eukprot:gene5806-6394_t
MFRRSAPSTENKKDEEVKKDSIEAIKALRSAAGLEKSTNQRSASSSSSRWPWTSLITYSILISCLLSSPLFYLLYTRLGFGALFPPQPFLTTGPAILPESSLEVVAELSWPPGNIAVTSKKRLFFTYHPEYHPPIKVAEWKNGQADAFPNASFQSQLSTVLSMRVDSKDRLWLLDFANHGISGLPRLYALNVAGNGAGEIIHEYVFPAEVAGFGSMLNDFQVDPKGEWIYIADTSILGVRPALVIYSITDRRSWRVLDDEPALHGLSTFLNFPTLSKPFAWGPLGIKIHVDSIALDRNGRWLYLGALTGDRLYAIDTTQVLQVLKSNGSTSSLGSGLIVACTEKPVTDGLTSDTAGNIWMTAVEHSALVVAVPFYSSKDKSSNPFFTVVKAVQSQNLLRWPDGLSFGPDGLYVTNSALHLRLAGKNITEEAPFHILRLPTRHLKNKDLYKGRGYRSTPSGQ